MTYPAVRTLVLGLLLAISGCGSRSGSPPAAPPPVPSPAATRAAGEITVFAAASLTDAFTEIGDRFAADNPGASVKFNFGASSQLFTQIEQGAPGDAFASADQIQMDRAKSGGYIDGADTTFATNRLVVITPANNPGGVSGPGDLAKPGLRFITSQPDVPIGVYTQSMLEKMSQDSSFGSDFHSRVNANTVSQEANVRQIVAKVQLGEADAAVVYRSDVIPQVASQLATFEIPDELNTLAGYPIGVLRESGNRTAATAFMTYVLSPTGQGILAKWNFIPVGPVGPVARITPAEREAA